MGHNSNSTNIVGLWESFGLWESTGSPTGWVSDTMIIIYCAITILTLGMSFGTFDKYKS